MGRFQQFSPHHFCVESFGIHEYNSNVSEAVMGTDFESIDRLIAQGQFHEAIDRLTSVLVEEPDNARALCLIGVAFTEAGENDKALAALNYGLKLDSQSVEGFEAAGCAHLRKKEYRDAETYLEKARALDPRNASVLRNLSVVYSQTHQHEKSLECLRTSYELNPDDYLTLYALSFACLNFDRVEEARGYLRKLLSTNVPEDIRALAEEQLVKIETPSS